jgi:hypothetical protein
MIRSTNASASRAFTNPLHSRYFPVLHVVFPGSIVLKQSQAGLRKKRLS